MVCERVQASHAWHAWKVSPGVVQLGAAVLLGNAVIVLALSLGGAARARADGEGVVIAPAPPIDPDAIREAIASNQPATPVGSAEAYLHYMEGNIVAERGDHAKAIEAYRLALALDEGAPQVRLRLAAEYWRAGLTDRAEAEARQAVRAAPRSAAARELLGNFLLQEDRPQAAAREFERALLSEPKRVECHRGLVQARFGIGEERGIERALDAWAKAVPEPLGWREYGELLFAHGDLARAERFLTRALAYRPEDPQALALLARLADERGENEKAMALYERSLRADPEDAAVLFALGQHHLQRAHLAKDPAPEIAVGRKLFRRLVAIAADEAPARADVAFAYLQAHLEPEALHELDLAVASEPENGRWRFERGMVEFQLRHYAAASEDLGSILPTDADYEDARAKLGLALYKLGNADAALAAVRAGLGEKPNSPQLAVELAEVQRAQGKGAEAVTFLERTVEDQDFRPELVEALADAYEGVGRLPDAIVLLQRVLKDQPDANRLRFVLGAKLQRSGDFDAAVSTMRELIRADPRNAEALNFIGYEFAERGIRLPEAEKLVELALSIDPRNGLIADSLGWVYFKEGKTRQAIELLQSARRLAPDMPVIAEHLGDVYVASGETDLAMDSYRLAIEALGDSPDPEIASSLRRKVEGLKARTASSAETP